MIDELKVLLPLMEEAGTAILKLQNNNLSISNKANNDIVTEGDLAANTILHANLIKYFPDHGWLSEESVDDLKRRQAQRVFIVDPIDGTQEFAKGIPEFAISVALVEAGVPIAAAIYNPATAELFHAEKGGGAWLNGAAIHCAHATSSRLNLLASRSEYKRGEWSRFEGQHDVKQVGSIAYKLALIAAGFGDATFSLGPKNEWDIAAGVLLVKEAGGFALTQTGDEFNFNQENVLVNGIVAASLANKEMVFDLIRDADF